MMCSWFCLPILLNPQESTVVKGSLGDFLLSLKGRTAKEGQKYAIAETKN